jgi:hypothetical protein
MIPCKMSGGFQVGRRGLKTPPAELGNAAAGDCHRRSRGLPSPQPAFQSLAFGLSGVPSLHMIFALFLQQSVKK